MCNLLNCFSKQIRLLLPYLTSLEIFTLKLFNAVPRGTNWSHVLKESNFFVWLVFVLVLVTLVSCGRNLKHSVRLIVNMSPIVEMLKTPAGVMSRTLDTCQGELSPTPQVQGF